jgi:hypothetical protein
MAPIIDFNRMRFQDTLNALCREKAMHANRLDGIPHVGLCD